MNVINEVLAPANWELTSPKEKLFSSDHVIDAYLRGKNEGLEQAQKLVLDKLVSNIKKAGGHATDTLNFLKQNKFNPIAAFLKINSWEDFSLLIVLPEAEFLDKKIIAAYNFISDLENKAQEDMYNIQISICDTESNIDENNVRSDGFILKYKVGR